MPITPHCRGAYQITLPRESEDEDFVVWSAGPTWVEEMTTNSSFSPGRMTVPCGSR